MPSSRRGIEAPPHGSKAVAEDGSTHPSVPASTRAPRSTRGDAQRSASQRAAKRSSRVPSSSRRSDGGDAFFPDPADGPAHAPDAFAEDLAEGFLTWATTGGERQPTEEELFDEANGGPFIISSERKELARAKADAEDFEAEAFPTSSANPSVMPSEADEEEE